MTDNEIIKALEEHLQKCQNIKYGARQKILVDSDFLKDVLDLINRQKAEIERLKADKEALINGQETLQKNLPKTIRAETITEFAAKVEQKCLDRGIYPACVKRAIEETKEEMTEQDND